MTLVVHLPSYLGYLLINLAKLHIKLKLDIKAIEGYH